MRADLEIIQQWIPANSRVLDLGCGDGELLSWLQDHKNVTGYGLEIDADNIAILFFLAIIFFTSYFILKYISIIYFFIFLINTFS